MKIVLGVDDGRLFLEWATKGNQLQNLSYFASDQLLLRPLKHFFEIAKSESDINLFDFISQAYGPDKLGQAFGGFGEECFLVLSASQIKERPDLVISDILKSIGGLENTFKRHELLALATRNACAALGLEFLAKKSPSAAVTAVICLALLLYFFRDRFGGEAVAQVPTGDPMQTGVGAASYALRADSPDITWDGAEAKIVPLRAAPGWTIAEGDPEIRGRAVFGIDGKVAGTVVDLWVDKADVLLRYVEVEVVGSGKRVLIPLGVVHWRGHGPVKVDTATGAQIAAAPTTAQAERVTLREEDRISGYFGGGELHCEPHRVEPLL